MTTIYTHICEGGGRFLNSPDPPDRRDPRMHFPHGWTSENRVETCRDCGDDAPVRGWYDEVDMKKVI
jgi:hypothetical protein